MADFPQRPESRKQDDSSVAYQMGRDSGQILELLRSTHKLLEKIMAAIDDLRAKVSELQATVDADQAADAQVVRDMQAEIDALKALGTDGATAEQVAEIIASLEAIKNDVAGPNAPPVEPPVEPVP